VPDPSASAIRELARNILARREYGLVNDNPTPRWAQWLGRLLDRIAVLRVDSPVLYWLFIAVISLVAVAAIVQMVWTLRAALRARPPAPPSKSVEQAPDLIAEAGRLAAAGRFLDAGHRLMIASFGLLAQRAVLELRPDCSNRWIRAALRESALGEALALEVGTLVERTERRWFGDRENEPGIYFDWCAVYQRLRASGE